MLLIAYSEQFTTNLYETRKTFASYIFYLLCTLRFCTLYVLFGIISYAIGLYLFPIVLLFISVFLIFYDLTLPSHRSVPHFDEFGFSAFNGFGLLSHWTVPPFLRFLSKNFLFFLLVLSFFVCVFNIACVFYFVKHFFYIF